LITARLQPHVAHVAMAFARRFTGPEALAAAIVDVVAPEDEVIARAVTLAGALAGKDRGTLAAIKRGLYARPLELLGLEPGPETLTALLALGAKG
jgi:enoyl-CoA hydratase/carnithine racemase